LGCRHQARRTERRPAAQSAAHLRELRCRWRAGAADHRPPAGPRLLAGSATCRRARLQIQRLFRRFLMHDEAELHVG
jgi:hypothetical protein